ncbi:hypothetical protein MTO96_013632 [Rhipicephalus appendiculatus]
MSTPRCRHCYAARNWLGVVTATGAVASRALVAFAIARSGRCPRAVRPPEGGFHRSRFLSVQGARRLGRPGSGVLASRLASADAGHRATANGDVAAACVDTSGPLPSAGRRRRLKAPA